MYVDVYVRIYNIHTYIHICINFQELYIYIPNKITSFSVAGMMGVGLRMVGVYGIRINDQQ